MMQRLPARAANLALITGNAGKPGAGVLFLGEKSNSHGIVDMGAVPDLLPGAQKLADEAVRQAFAKAWGAAIAAQPGLTAEQIIAGAEQGTIKALYCAGENPVQAYPDTKKIKTALRQAAVSRGPGALPDPHGAAGPRGAARGKLCGKRRDLHQR